MPIFWAAHQGAELDLLLTRGARPGGTEAKRGGAPALTATMRIALKGLKLDQLWVAYPGERTYPPHERVTALPFDSVTEMTGRDLFEGRGQSL